MTNTETKTDIAKRKSRSILSFVTDKISPVALALVLLVVLAFGGAAFGYILWSQRTIVNLSEENKALAQQNLISQNNHHASTDKKNTQLAAALNEANTALTEVKASAAAIQYEGGVIAYQNGEIIAAQQAGHATLNAITALQMQLSGAETSVGAALTKGQAQINAYLGYLTCLVTNMSNQAVCGSAPPLPVTSTTGG